MSTEESRRKFNEIVVKKNELREGFIKHLLLMASSLFGILVALHKVSSTDKYTRIAFAAALLLLSHGILFLSIALYAQVSAYKLLQQKSAEDILLQDLHNHPPKSFFANPHKFYEFFEKLGYIFLLLAVVFLAIYAVLVS